MRITMAIKFVPGESWPNPQKRAYSSSVNHPYLSTNSRRISKRVDEPPPKASTLILLQTKSRDLSVGLSATCTRCSPSTGEKTSIENDVLTNQRRYDLSGITISPLCVCFRQRQCECSSGISPICQRTLIMIPQ